jgi:hypothetical protein
MATKQDFKGLADKVEALISSVEQIKDTLFTLAAGRDDESKLALVATGVTALRTEVATANKDVQT